MDDMSRFLFWVVSVPFAVGFTDINYVLYHTRQRIGRIMIAKTWRQIMETTRVAPGRDSAATMNEGPNNSHLLIRKTDTLRGKNSQVRGRFEWLQDTVVSVVFAVCLLTVVTAVVLAVPEVQRVALTGVTDFCEQDGKTVLPLGVCRQFSQIAEVAK